MFFRTLLIFLCFLVSSYTKSQNPNFTKIDSLQISNYKRLRHAGNFKGIINQEIKTIRMSKKFHYQKGEIRGYLNIAVSLLALGDTKKGLYFLQIAENKMKNFEDPELKSRLYYYYGYNYYSAGLNNKAIKIFDKGLQIATNIDDKKIRDSSLCKLYEIKALCNDKLDNNNALYSYEKRCKYQLTPILFITIAKRHIGTKNLDSAEYYVAKAESLLKTRKVPIEGTANVLRAKGELLIAKNKNQKALQYLYASLRITNKCGFRKRDLETYKLLSEAYRNLSNKDEENKYLLKYSTLKDSITNIEREVLDMPILNRINKESDINIKNGENIFYLSLVLLIVCISGIFFLRSVNKKILKKLSLEKENTELLQRKINDSFAELVNMAKENNSHFWSRFQEVYPDFTSKLLQINSKLKVSELTYCAYVYLGFSTKEIADYTFKAVKTIENNRYNLRKKLKISSDQDFQVWIRNLK